MATPALAAFQKRIGISFKDVNLLNQAITHKSLASDPELNNDKLSLLGSKVLNLYVGDFLDSKYPKLPKEAVSSMTEAYIGNEALYKLASGVGLIPILRWKDPALMPAEPAQDKSAMASFSKRKVPLKVPVNVHEESHRSTELNSLQIKQDKTGVVRVAAKGLSALIGAVYRDSGNEPVKQFILSTVLTGKLDVSKHVTFPEPKRRLSELLAKQKKEKPLSRILKETGRNSSHPLFIVGVFSGTEKLGEGAGSSLSMAEHRAAQDALYRFYVTENAGTAQPFEQSKLDQLLQASSISSADSKFQDLSIANPKSEIKTV